MEKLNENELKELKELKRITGVIEENCTITNIGYENGDNHYIYGKFLDKKIDVDNDLIEKDLLYIEIDNKVYKVINEDIEEFKNN